MPRIERIMVFRTSTLKSRRRPRQAGCLYTVNASQDKRLKTTLIIAVIACFIFLPVAFYYGIFGILTFVSAAVALQHFIAVFRSRSRADECWGAGTKVRFRMSRLSRLVIGLWFMFITTHLIMRGLLKLPSSAYYLVGHAAFALLVAVARWMDTGRFVR